MQEGKTQCALNTPLHTIYHTAYYLTFFTFDRFYQCSKLYPNDTVDRSHHSMFFLLVLVTLTFMLSFMHYFFFLHWFMIYHFSKTLKIHFHTSGIRHNLLK